MIENYFVMLVTHLKSLVDNIVGNVGMTHAIFKIETNHGLLDRKTQSLLRDFVSFDQGGHETNKQNNV
jgi:hypothetical protein